MRTLAAILLLALIAALDAPRLAVAEPFDTPAPVALLIDLRSGMVLLDKNADKPFEPAAMVKLATIAVVADALASGEISQDTDYPVSENAWRRGGAPSGGATMFAALKSRVRVGDLLRGAMVQAANDACLILAEGLAGSEPAFVERMAALGRKIGLTGTVFANATGLADPRQHSTARDVARLARYLIEAHPEIYAIYAEKEFTWNKIRQLNRNPLLAAYAGADGLATGASDGGGFGLVASAKRDERRLILGIQGLDSAKTRAEAAPKLLDWGFGSFAEKQVFAADEVVGEARVFGGDAWSVPLTADGPVLLPVRSDAPDALAARIVYDGPVPAPVAAGQPLGRLEIRRDGRPALTIPLKAKTAVGVGGLGRRAAGALYEMAIGLVRVPVGSP